MNITGLLDSGAIVINCDYSILSMATQQQSIQRATVKWLILYEINSPNTKQQNIYNHALQISPHEV